MILNPGVYYIKKNEQFNFYQLNYAFHKFEEPKKIYGDMLQRCIRIWNHYAISKESTGCMFTGSAGSGKTKAGELLCNLAIDNNLPVVMCVEIEFDIELIRYLSALTDCVLFFDEFKKNVNYTIERQMLTMLADNTKRRLFIITENTSGSISEYIRDRPGRIRYHYDYDKISKAVFEDFCNDFKLSNEFKADLIDKYKTSNVFTFDQLQAIIYEHLHYPEDKLEDLLNILNLHTLKKPRKFKLLNVTRSVTWDDVKWNYTFKFIDDEEFRFKNRYGKHSITINREVLKPYGENGSNILISEFYMNYEFQYSDLLRVDDTNNFILEFPDKENKEIKFKAEIILE